MREITHDLIDDARGGRSREVRDMTHATGRSSGRIRSDAIRIAMASALCVATTFSFADAAAQSICLPRKELGKQLERTFSEQPLAYGVTEDGALLEVFSSHDGLTWTLVITVASGQSCVLATGDSWTTLPVRLTRDLPV